MNALDAADELIRLTIENGIARITFARPERRNAMDFATARRWRDVARAVAQDPAVRAAVIWGEGPAFCAGGDVIDMATSGATGAEVTETAREIHEGIRALVEAPFPIVAAVHGAVAGGGIGLMLTADYVVARDTTVIVSRYAAIALSPDLGVSTLLSEAVGTRRALQLLLSDQALTAAEALEWGLVAEVVSDADADARPELARAEQLALEWSGDRSEAYARAKTLVRNGAPTFAERLEAEAVSIGESFDTDASRRAVAAFAARSRG